MTFSNASCSWFALQVKGGLEQTTAYLLRSKGYEEFVPTYKAIRSSRSTERPLFPGYVFCRFEPGIKAPIVTTPGVIRVLGFGNTPAPLCETEIDAIRKIVASMLDAEPHTFPNAGQTVRIMRGPLSGIVGRIVESKDGDRFVVSVTLLQRAVAVDLPAWWLEPVNAEDETEALAVAFETKKHSTKKDSI